MHNPCRQRSEGAQQVEGFKSSDLWSRYALYRSEVGTINYSSMRFLYSPQSLVGPASPSSGSAFHFVVSSRTRRAVDLLEASLADQTKTSLRACVLVVCDDSMLRRYLGMCLRPHAGLTVIDRFSAVPTDVRPTVVVADLYTIRHEAEVAEEMLGTGGVLNDAPLLLLSQDVRRSAADLMGEGTTIRPRVTLELPIKPKKLVGVVSVLAGGLEEAV